MFEPAGVEAAGVVVVVVKKLVLLEGTIGLEKWSPGFVGHETINLFC